jgi:SAM-dependent MidA family methyltransferase
MLKLELPQPDAAAVEHSAQLTAIIRNTIAAKAGWIDFSEFMQLALYAPGMGYYSAGSQKLGEHGDFITAPEISPLFGQTLANPVASILGHLPDANIIEFGAGSGQLAVDLLLQLQQLNALPQTYFIIEVSAELQQRQSQTILQQAPHLHNRVVWLHGLPAEPVVAVVLANEVLDAMPVTRFIKRQGVFYPLGVSIRDSEFYLNPGAYDEHLHGLMCAIEAELGFELSDDYCSEINLNISPWLKSIAAMLQQGVVYLVDYGYPRREYYLPERSMGTLMCYFQHRCFDDPLRYPGLQDMTAFVDFTAVAESAVAAGFDVQGYTSQANYLLDCGLPDMLEAKMGKDARKNLYWVQQMKSLTLPSEMGERFKVMLLAKNIDLIIPGFGVQDMRNRL